MKKQAVQLLVINSAITVIDNRRPEVPKTLLVRILHRMLGYLIRVVSGRTYTLLTLPNCSQIKLFQKLTVPLYLVHIKMNIIKGLLKNWG